MNFKAHDTPAIVLRKIFFLRNASKITQQHAISCAIHCTKRLVQPILRNTIAGVVWA